MSEKILTIKKRDDMDCGTTASRNLRKEGLIPANLMHNGKSTSIACSISEFTSLYNSGLRYSSVIHLKEDKKDVAQVIIRQLQRHPITENILHIDFYTIETGKEAIVTIDVEQIGTAPGVKAGGILNQYIKNLKVQLLPEEIKEYVECDVSKLQIEDGIKVQDLNVPPSWKILTKATALVLKINPSRLSTQDRFRGRD